jgi:glycosyltransferase involved in cell wall biosynthesis
MDLTNTISVIVTTYNRRSLLERALHSILNQTLPAGEIICIDDGSTDGTSLMINDKFPQIRYFRQENKGISAARNEGIKQTKGAWLAFLDSDDTWHPQKLAKQMQALTEACQYLICYTDEIWIRNRRRVNPKKIHRKYRGAIYKKCLPLCIISPSSVLMHRSVINSIGLFDESMPACEDYDLWLRICIKYPVLYLDEPLITKFGGHEDQLSKKYHSMDRFRIYAMEKMLKSPGLSEENKRATLRELISKIDIYLIGLRKRNKTEEIEIYKQKKRVYQACLS